MLLETDYSSEAFKENINILLLLTGSFPPKSLKTTAHGLPKISRNLSSNGPTFDKKYKKGFLFSNIGIKQGKMGTETSKIALNAHVHLRTANQPMSRPERHVDDITDMRRSCRLRENTSGRRPLSSSSRLLKVPNVVFQSPNYLVLYSCLSVVTGIVLVAKLLLFSRAFGRSAPGIQVPARFSSP